MHRGRRRVAGRSLAACLIAGGTIASAASPLAGQACAARQRAADTGAVVLTLLHTNDLHGRVHLPGEPQGLAKIATLVRGIRAAHPRVLLLDAGDIIHGTPEELTFAGRPIIAAMNAAGYDAAVAGNHEFDFGQVVTRDAIRAARFPVLSANVRQTATGEPWGGLTPYVMLDAGGLCVAVFGLTTTQTVQIEWPRTIAGIAFGDPIAAARSLVPQLRARERADVVVALTHLGVSVDTALARAVPGIDVILGGHSHTRLDRQIWIGNTLVTQTGSYARALGRTDLLLSRVPEGGYRVSAVNGRADQWWGWAGVPRPDAREYPATALLPLTVALRDDSAVAAAYAPFAASLRSVLDRVLTHAAEALPADALRNRESVLGTLVADAVRAQARADVAFAAASQLGPDGLAEGDVRVRDLYRLLPAYTRQHIVIARVPGSELRRVLEATANGAAIGLHVSGARRDGDQLMVGDQPLDDQRRYDVAAAAHVIQEQLLGRPGVEILRDDARDPTIRDAAIRFLDGHAALRARR